MNTYKSDDYNNWTKEELIEEIKRLKGSKKYGIVWEDKPEETDNINTRYFLKEVKENEIVTGEHFSFNTLIEGDNYHSLMILNEIYQGKIDVIYIDPPYNTGSEFCKYNNNYVDKNDNWRHSKWLSMMNRRLQLAKNLLKEDGVFVCSIDDYELFALGLLLDEIFGEKNRIGIVCVQHHPRGRTQSKFFSTTHEYCLFYAKDKKKLNLSFCFPSDRGEEYESFIRAREDATPERRPNLYYPIYYNPETKGISLEKINDDFIEILPILQNGRKRVWKLIKESFLEELKNNNIFVKKSGERYSVYRRINRRLHNKAKTVWYEPEYDANIHGTNLLKNILNKNEVFTFPKSIYTIMDAIQLISRKDSLILDFFAGSGTTGHAVLQLNKIDNLNRRFILCTSNENNICTDVCYPRLKRVMQGYYNNNGKFIEGLGGNLRYYKVGCER